MLIFVVLMFYVGIPVSLALIFIIAKARRLVPEKETSSISLTVLEKILVWVLSIINPVFAFAIFHFGWNKKLPIKAQQASRISFILMFLWFAMFFVYPWINMLLYRMFV